MDMLEELRKHLRETPKEELKKEWEEVKEFSAVGPSAKEFMQILDLYDKRSDSSTGRTSVS